MTKYFQYLPLGILILVFSGLFSFQSLNAQLVSDFIVHPNDSFDYQSGAKLGVDGAGNINIVWVNNELSQPNIFCQRFDSSCNFIGNSFQINLNPDSSHLPMIAVSQSGNFAVSWFDVNNSFLPIYTVKCRIFNNDGTPLTNEIILNDSAGVMTGLPAISVSLQNEYIVTWGFNNIYYQRLDSVGNKIGGNRIVNDSIDCLHLRPDITIRKDGSFIITWSDTRPPSTSKNDDIYYQMFNRNGERIGINTKVNDDANPERQQHFPKISSDSLGNFIIAWSDNRLLFDQSEIYAQMYIHSGMKNGTNFRVTQSDPSSGKGICNVVKKPNGEFIIGWGEFFGFTPRPYFQRFNSSGLMIGSSFPVTLEAPSVTKYYRDFVIYNNRIINVWDDLRNGNSDVYCNVRSFQNPDSTVNIIEQSEFLENFSLFQNFPNPFNSSTKIRFNIKFNGTYKLEIFNVVGQKISTVFNKYINSGFHTITLKSDSFTSGLYFYSLSDLRSNIIKKFVVIK